jgi:two-component system sensor histidine kinase ChvG
MWRSVRRFREAARQTWQGRIEQNSFSARNVIPELTSVAADFDRLVFELHHTAENIREIAENNAHAFKSPVATIQSSLDVLKKELPLAGRGATRATALIDSSLERLRGLISVAQKLDYNAADLLETPRARLDLAKIVDEILAKHRPTLSAHEIELSVYAERGVAVSAGRVSIEIAIENILDNAISFSPRNSTLTIRLFKTSATAELFVEDEGPGIESAMLDHIFERHVSLRKMPRHANGADQEVSTHAGLGLWIARQNVEASGGTLTAANRAGAGLSVRIALPLEYPT